MLPSRQLHTVKVLSVLAIVLGIICFTLSIISLSFSCNNKEVTLEDAQESVEEDSRYVIHIQKDNYNNILIREVIDTETGITTTYTFRYSRSNGSSQCDGYSVIIFDKDGNILEKLSN